MTIVFLEGLVITVLVLTRFREAVMDAVRSRSSARSSIGLFIAFIGFFTSGLVVKPASGPLPVGLGTFKGFPIAVFVIGFFPTAWLMARRMQGAAPRHSRHDRHRDRAQRGLRRRRRISDAPARLACRRPSAPDLSTFGRLDFGVFAKLTAALVIFSIMLSDFFDTMGTIIGVGGRGGFLDARGRLPGANRVLLVDSLGAMFGGFANSSSNTTYIESAAGVAEGARTGLAPVVTGLLFLGAMFFSPLASVIPAQATAPALIIVGFFMMGIVREIPWEDYEQAIPAFVTMLAMPFTWSITNGIGAGFVTFAAIKLLGGAPGAALDDLPRVRGLRRLLLPSADRERRQVAVTFGSPFRKSSLS